MAKDLQHEIPFDQVWVSCPEFENALYDHTVTLPPIHAITYGPKFHWFSYYDKFQFDASNRFVLSMEIDFEGQSPGHKDVVTIGMIDTEDNNKWIELGQSKAWCWQQGCMLQWRPGSGDEILWNDREGNRFVCHILNVKTNQKRTLPYPIYHVHPDGKWALGTDFARIQLMRPGYGYAGIEDRNAEVLAPDDSCIYLLNLDSAECKPLFSCADISKIPYPDADCNDDKHYFNCPAWNNEGSRFLFLDRWRSAKGKWDGFKTRIFTASFDGTDIRLVTDKPGVSHFAWRDPEHIVLWREGAYRLYKDDCTSNENIILQATNGHINFLPNNEWMIADTYHDKNNYQNLYLFHMLTKEIVPLGHFYLPPEYRGGELRCDLHPRISRDGQSILIDSTHGGNGRQMYLIDIGNIFK